MSKVSAYRALPTDSLNATWLGAGGIDAAQLAPGQITHLAAVDQFGVQLVRVVGGDPYPLPIDFTKYDVYVQNVDKYGQRATPPEQWSVSHAPGGNAQATCTQAGVVGYQHFVNTISAVVVCGTAGVPVLAQLQLRASVSGTLMLHNFESNAMPVGNVNTFILSGLNIAVPIDEGVTWQFTVAGGVNVRQSVAMTGYTGTP